MLFTIYIFYINVEVKFIAKFPYDTKIGNLLILIRTREDLDKISMVCEKWEEENKTMLTKWNLKANNMSKIYAFWLFRTLDSQQQQCKDAAIKYITILDFINKNIFH